MTGKFNASTFPQLAQTLYTKVWNHSSTPEPVELANQINLVRNSYFSLSITEKEVIGIEPNEFLESLDNIEDALSFSPRQTRELIMRHCSTILPFTTIKEGMGRLAQALTAHTDALRAVHELNQTRLQAFNQLSTAYKGGLNLSGTDSETYPSEHDYSKVIVESIRAITPRLADIHDTQTGNMNFIHSLNTALSQVSNDLEPSQQQRTNLPQNLPQKRDVSL